MSIGLCIYIHEAICVHRATLVGLSSYCVNFYIPQHIHTVCTGCTNLLSVHSVQLNSV